MKTATMKIIYHMLTLFTVSQLLFSTTTKTTTTTTISCGCDGFLIHAIRTSTTFRTAEPTTAATTSIMMSSLSAPTPTPTPTPDHNEIPARRNIVPKTTKTITSVDEAWRIIDACSIQSSISEGSDDEIARPLATAATTTYDQDNMSLLWDAVHYVEQHSFEYSTEELQTIWDNAHGYWQLVVSTGSPHSTEFHRPPWFLPKFQFAMVDDMNFGNGLGTSPTNIWLALKDKYTYDFQHRRLEVAVDEVYILGHKVTNPFRQKQKQKQQQQQVAAQELDGNSKKQGPKKKGEQPPPTFVLIGASDKTLLARGNQSGGIAIWSRLKDSHTTNVQASAYGQVGT